MIRLGKIPVKPYWLDLPHGVRVFVRPLNTAIYEQAAAMSRRILLRVLEDHREIEAVGGSVSGLPDLSDADGRAGTSQLLFSQGLAKAAILDWEGVNLDGEQDADGNPVPAPVTPELVEQFMMIHNMAESFTVKYTATHERLILEGNGLRPLPNGTSAGAGNTAHSAAKTDSPARMESPA